MKRHIYDQGRLIERLADQGQSTDDAFALLNLLTQSLRQLERYRLLVLEQLGKGKMTETLLLKRASASRPSGEWNDDDYDVLADGVVVGRILKVHAAPVGSPWMWTLAFGHHEDRTPTHGYEPTREAAMAAFVKSWRYESRQRRVNRTETITMAPSGTSYG